MGLTGVLNGEVKQVVVLIQTTSAVPEHKETGDGIPALMHQMCRDVTYIRVQPGISPNVSVVNARGAHKDQSTHFIYKVEGNIKAIDCIRQFRHSKYQVKRIPDLEWAVPVRTNLRVQDPNDVVTRRILKSP